MTRTFTAICAAAAFGMVASVGAQSTGQTGTSTDPYSHGARSDRSGKSDEVTVTGCLQKGADGNYILTNANVDRGMMGAESGRSHQGATGATSGTSGTSSTAGATSTGATSSATPSERSGSMMSTWELQGGKDLDKHVGHRIQVKGRVESMGSSSENYGESTGMTGTTAGAMSGSTTGSTAGTTGSTAGSTTGTTAQSGTSTGSTAGTTGTTAGTTGSTAQSSSMPHHGEMGNTSSMHRLDVKSVKMISTSCS